MPIIIVHILANFFAWILHHLISYRKDVIDENLKNSFPEKSKSELREIRKEFYRNFSMILIEIIRLLGFNKRLLPGRVQISNPELLQQIFDEGKSVIAVGGHYYNWEWMGTVLPAIVPFRVIGVYRPLSNKLIDGIMLKIRSINGTNLIPMKSAYREIKLSKQPTLSYLISDQAPSPEQAYWTTFLNQETPVFLGPEKIARGTGNSVVFMRMNRIKKGYYTVQVDMISENPFEEPEFSITEKHVRALESQIIEDPAPWLWSHKRWKHKRNK